jgi:uncharacterized caspase-like protein
VAGLLRGPLSLQLPDRQVTVVDDPVAAHTVVGAVRQAAVEATDTLIVYFAGHGLVDGQDQLSLALPHTEFGRIETGLPYDWVRQVLLLESRAERHVVILDCCYSGLALGRMSAGVGLADQAAVEGSFSEGELTSRHAAIVRYITEMVDGRATRRRCGRSARP